MDVLFGKNMLPENYMRWGVRIAILLVIGFFIWRVTRHKKYTYDGLHSYKPNWFDQFARHFTKQIKKRPRVNKTEEMCRKIIQDIYHKPFPSVRPDFLRNPRTHKNLELDCYNAELKIALEYNGQQHYTYTQHFHKNKRNFFSQVHRDDWKRKRCRELGIRLIEVPYWVSPVNLRGYITQELSKKGCL